MSGYLVGFRSPGDRQQAGYFAAFCHDAEQTLSGVGKEFPYADDYLTTTVPATKAGLGPAFPFALNASGQNFKSLVQLRSGGVRPLFEQGWLFWNAGNVYTEPAYLVEEEPRDEVKESTPLPLWTP